VGVIGDLGGIVVENTRCRRVEVSDGRVMVGIEDLSQR
jgi:hypothetical protein